MKSWVGTGEWKEGKSVCCVVMNVRESCIWGTEDLAGFKVQNSKVLCNSVCKNE